MDFNAAVQIILQFEGGYINHPADPGGETNFGISKRAYPDLDIKELTKEQAIEIYYQDFWNKLHCDKIPQKLRLLVFDCAVNQGAGFATRALQESVGAQVDGIIGPKTMEKIQSKYVMETIYRFAIRRKERYFKSPGFKTFGRGWMARLIHVIILTSGDQ